MTKYLFASCIVVIFAILCIIGCPTKSPEYIEPEPFTTDDYFDKKISEYRNSLGEFDVSVQLCALWEITDNEGRQTIYIRGENSFHIESISMFIDDNELSVYTIYTGSMYQAKYVLLLDRPYHIRLVVNDIIKETDFTIPSDADISLQNSKFNPKKPYTFEWIVPNDTDVQFVGAILEWFAPSHYFLSQLNPDERNYTIEKGTIHSKYTFQAVLLSRMSYKIQNRTLFYVLTYNEKGRI